MKPFLKWAGGKRRIAHTITDLLNIGPSDPYFEVFTGGGAVFFHLRTKGHIGPAYLSDVNAELVATYRAVRDDVEELIALLSDYDELHSEAFYYSKRLEDWKYLEDDAEIGARMIYLNKAGFNGLYRVNKAGGFNVPFGHNLNANILDEDNLRACSVALQGVALAVAGFRSTIRSVKSGFVYCDPPYVPISATSNFVGYTAKGFTADDQIDLRDEALKAKRRGVRIVLSNADVEPVRVLYSTDFDLHEIKVARPINSKSTGRGKVGELLIY